jgi:hypothetical protein
MTRIKNTKPIGNGTSALSKPEERVTIVQSGGQLRAAAATASIMMRCAVHTASLANHGVNGQRGIPKNRARSAVCCRHGRGNHGGSAGTCPYDFSLCSRNSNVALTRFSPAGGFDPTALKTFPAPLAVGAVPD